MAIDPKQKRLLIREFELNGFVVLRGFLPLDLVEGMHEQPTPLLKTKYQNAVADGWGEGQWKRGWTNVETCWRGSQYMGWHSDQAPQHMENPDHYNETIRVTFNIPLLDFTARNGAMEVLPATHRTPRNCGAVDDLTNIYPHQLRLDRGDPVLRDGNMFHRGTPNLDSAPRPMLDQTYLGYRGNVSLDRPDSRRHRHL